MAITPSYPVLQTQSVTAAEPLRGLLEANVQTVHTADPVAVLYRPGLHAGAVCPIRPGVPRITHALCGPGGTSSSSRVRSAPLACSLTGRPLCVLARGTNSFFRTGTIPSLCPPRTAGTLLALWAALAILVLALAARMTGLKGRETTLVIVVPLVVVVIVSSKKKKRRRKRRRTGHCKTFQVGKGCNLRSRRRCLGRNLQSLDRTYKWLLRWRPPPSLCLRGTAGTSVGQLRRSSG